RLADGPRSAAIGRMEHPRRLGPARRKPDVLRAVRHDATAAGGEASFSRQSSRQALVRKRSPVRASIIGHEQLEVTVYRIAQYDAGLLVPKCQGVEKSLRIGQCELL